ncbi:MAG: right-handed parallel beta-helix repeat-containing protein, partial [Methanophagales archaeon]|nr:right-handed parallel beta-helix repeat-containing protein [Methanophagales archaeon]
DTGVEYTYDPVMQDWKKKVAPYSAIVCKDGSTVWAEDSDGKTIASGEAGVDDASVIQSAIDSMPTYGGIIKIKAHDLILGNVDIKDNITIIGDAHQTGTTYPSMQRVKANTSASYVFKTEGHNVKLQNLLIDGRNSDTTLILLEDKSCSILKNITLLNTNGYGIHVKGMYNIYWYNICIRDCGYKDNNTYSVFFDVSSSGRHNSGAVIYNLEVFNTDSGNRNTAIAFKDAVGFEIKDIRSGTEGVNIAAPVVHFMSGGLIKSIRWFGGSIFDCPSILLKIEDGYSIKIHGLITNKGYDGIQVVGGNQIHINNCRGTENRRYGLYIDTHDVYVLGGEYNDNSLDSENAYDGIRIGYGGGDVLILGAAAKNINYSNQRCGISAAPVSNIRIIACDVRNNLTSGIDASTAFIKYCIGYITENSGTATFDGDGTTTDFLIGDHGLAVTDPSKIVVKVSPISSDAIAASPCIGYVDPADNTKIRVKFASAPASGTGNVKIVWEAQVVS